MCNCTFEWEKDVHKNLYGRTGEVNETDTHQLFDAVTRDSRDTFVICVLCVTRRACEELRNKYLKHMKEADAGTDWTGELEVDVPTLKALLDDERVEAVQYSGPET